MQTSRSSWASFICLSLGCASTAHAADSHDADELARQLANPVASLISVPLQINQDDGIGPADDGERLTINVQPVIPFALNDRWNVISRTIVPVIHQSDIFPGAGSQTGRGDVLQSAFLSPRAPTSTGWIWGVGPALLLKTSTDDLLGQEQWGAGPTAVLLKQHGPWTYGFLTNHLWRVAGDDDRPDVDATFAQPFLTYGLGQGQTVSLNFESTYDWTASEWNAPFHASYSKVTRFGSQLVSLAGGVRYYVDKPDSGADWGVRFTFTLLFPRAPAQQAGP